MIFILDSIQEIIFLVQPGSIFYLLQYNLKFLNMFWDQTTGPTGRRPRKRMVISSYIFPILTVTFDNIHHDIIVQFFKKTIDCLAKTF